MPHFYCGKGGWIAFQKNAALAAPRPGGDDENLGERLSNTFFNNLNTIRKSFFPSMMAYTEFLKRDEVEKWSPHKVNYERLGW